MMEIILGIMIPFIGTSAGAALVFFVKKELNISVQRAINGFAAGVMTAAAFWSLIVPAIEQSADMGKLSFLPAFVGIWLGILFLLLLDHVIPHLHSGANTEEGPKSNLARTTMMVLAVTLHNIPEGIAVGVVAAGLINGSVHITLESFIALSVGIALHNVPEGALISVLMRAEGKNKWKSFVYGALSGAVEPIFALLTIAASSLLVPAMPYLLSFAAGAMIYVVVEELIPEMSHGEHSNIGVITFAVGFTAMMALDIGLG
ncbi:MAG: ZIP family metal transporter [Clostridiales bacterium]|nr:ZIP family metal transporter [Clostridiales bacterium]